MKSGPIGVFDSGVGGLTVLREITRSLPLESVVYLGDNRRMPYGQLPAEAIREYALQGLDYLYGQGAKALVLACNTATAVALEAARERYDIPVLGVIEPTALAAASAAGERVGVLATAATVLSGQYREAILTARPGVEVVQQACPLLARLVEEGDLASARTNALVAQYLEPLIQRGVDTIVLGCTHYPFLRLSIERLAGRDVTLIESGQPVVDGLKALMSAGSIVRAAGPGERRLATTGNPDLFLRLASMLWPGESLQIEEADIEVSNEQLHLQAA